MDGRADFLAGSFAVFPILRSFRSSNQLVLADGQSAQFSVATDRITGEIIRAELTLRVLK